MGKITKRVVDALQGEPDRDVFAWVTELRGFGVRAKPSGVKTFLIQYRNSEGRTRRLVLGQYGALTPENARHLARKKLTAVAEGADPSADRQGGRTGMSVKEVCDWYLEQAEAGRLLGRNRRPIKASTLKSDRGRVMREVAADGEHPTGLAAIRLMLLTGFRRMEVLGLKRPWFSRRDHCIRFPDTKSGARIRALGEAAMYCIEAQPTRAGSLFVFPADWGDGHFMASSGYSTVFAGRRNLRP
jgi:hypothetical protein